MSVISHADFLNVAENRAMKKATDSAGSRQPLMRRIGVFELIDGEYVGHIAMMNFKCRVVIRDNPHKIATTDADYVVEHLDAEMFHAEIGFAWEKMTDGQNLPYLSVHLDDPSFAKTIVAVLVRSHANMYSLYWDRVTITDGDIERVLITEELQPYTGVFRRISKVTDYLISIYPSLAEIWDPDYD